MHTGDEKVVADLAAAYVEKKTAVISGMAKGWILMRIQLA